VVFLESHARILLVLHAVVGAATVAVTTHLVLWLRPRAGRPPRMEGVRWFATAALILYLGQLALGLLLYPSYKVHVRAEYFDLASAQTAEVRLRRDAHREVLEQAGIAADEVAGSAPTQVAQAFDIKEHVVALALPLIAAACALAWSWRPERDGPFAGRLLLGCAAGAALAAWLGALVGLWATSYRSVGP
jgi:hypothetical protein